MEFQILVTITIVLFLALAGMLIFFIRQGIFRRVKPEIEETGGYAITHQQFDGKPEEVLKQLETQAEILRKHNIGFAHPLCIYNGIPEPGNETIRSYVGFVLYSGTKENLIELSRELPLSTFEKKKRIVVRFPYHGRLSIQFGIMKAYPAMIKYASKHNLKIGDVTELYNGIEKRIEYMIDIDR